MNEGLRGAIEFIITVLGAEVAAYLFCIKIWRDWFSRKRLDYEGIRRIKELEGKFKEHVNEMNLNKEQIKKIQKDYDDLIKFLLENTFKK